MPQCDYGIERIQSLPQTRHSSLHRVFVVAASGETSDLSAVYYTYLLRRNPSMVGTSDLVWTKWREGWRPMRDKKGLVIHVMNI